jgi:2-polyprenyl-6-methoxyphenol hydroxylase-like FAD-dependent oxidoreductase
MTTEPTILVVGAGPTGLTTACALLSQGVPVRVVDRRSGTATAPKALILWSGALEVLDRLEVAEPLVERALALDGASYWSRGKKIGGVTFRALSGTRFPGPLCVPQPVTEELLHARFTELGGSVEWNTEVRGVTAAAEEVSVRLTDAEGTETTTRVRWLVAADGTHSTVREAVGIGFEGRTYPRDFLLGDVVLESDGQLELPPREAQYHLTPEGVLVLVALPGGGHRVFFDQAAGAATEAPDRDELQRLLDERGPGHWQITDTWWTSRFQVHTKVATAFRSGGSGPVFLAGDAAHCHSPAGGQGLNTGVQDGYDIGWKLAAVCRGADPALLDSYEAERRPTAVRVVRNADRQTKLWLVRSPLVRTLRDTLLGRLSRTGALERRVVPELAQVDLDLSDSPAVDSSVKPSGGIRPGRRIPDLDLVPAHGTKATTLHGYLSAGRHTVVVFDDGAGDRAARAARDARAHFDEQAADVLLVRQGGGAPGADGTSHEAPGHDLAAGPHGRTAQAVYVRPDGMVGARADLNRPDGLGALLARVPVPGNLSNHL